MKLRNKKTGDVWEFDEGFSMKASQETAERAGARSASLTCFADSISELNEEWEDYNPTEPLIKDEKIRKAVRAWADANMHTLIQYNIAKDCLYFLSGTDYSDTSISISFDEVDVFKELEHRRTYTITELCGEDEE